MIVQRTSNLLSSASWTKVTNAIQVINSSNVVALPIIAESAIFPAGTGSGCEHDDR